METIKKTDIIYLPLSSIKPYDKNNRKHNETQVDRIAKSIKEFGFNQPIVVDEDDTILVGHGRLEASIKLKLKEVPVLRLKGLKESQKKAYRILDNKLQNDSEWDFDNVNLELGFLEDDGFDLKEWGLDELRLGEVEGKEFDESIADGMERTEIIKIEISIDESEKLKKEISKILEKYSTGKII